MKKRVKGNFTIEAAVIVPTILMIFVSIITLLFYCHDKNVLTALTHETLVMCCSKEEITEEEAETYLRVRMGNKLILFGTANFDVTIQENDISILCIAQKRIMKIQIQQNMARTNPEQYIWKIRRLEQLGKGVEIN